MGRRFIHKAETYEEPSVNLTPLIDVVFVILIIFILIAPLLELEHVELAQAAYHQDRTAPIGQSSPIVIHVQRDNTIRLNQRSVILDELEGELGQMRELYPQAVPQLFHDRKAYFGTYQSVKNSAEAAGFQKLEMILQPSDES